MSELKFPLFVDLTGRKVLVYGAGKIAARRISVLLRFGAAVTVIAPEIVPELRELQGLQVEQRAYCPGQMPPAYLVLAATNQLEVNRQITAEARRLGALANNASDHSDCDFYFPAVITAPELSVGVCGSGHNHGAVRDAAAKIRKMELET